MSVEVVVRGSNDDEIIREMPISLQDDPVVHWLADYLITSNEYANELGEDGLLLLAQAAVWLDAIVYPSAVNELHMYPHESIAGVWVIHIGINYWRRIGDMRGGYEIVDMRPMPLDKYATFHIGNRIAIPNKDTIYHCRAYSLDKIQRAIDIGYNYREYIERHGREGYGVHAYDETVDGGRSRSKFSAQFYAEKRAETNALKKLFSIMPATFSRYHQMYWNLQTGFRSHSPYPFEVSNLVAVPEKSPAVTGLGLDATIDDYNDFFGFGG